MPKGAALALVAGLLLATAQAAPRPVVQAISEKTSYDVGAEARIRLNFLSHDLSNAGPLNIFATVRYEGQEEPVIKHARILSSHVVSTRGRAAIYYNLWKIPDNAKTGRYDVALEASAASSGKIVFNVPDAATFVVHRKLLRIDRVEVSKRFYAPGDPVGCKVTISNLTEHPMHGLRVEFSERYWPWTAVSAKEATPSVRLLATSLSLKPEQTVERESPDCATAGPVKKPVWHQYGVVVWDHDRRNIYDISFSPLVFIRPPGIILPMPYPLQYVYPNLSDLKFSAYRHFYPSQSSCPAIKFDSSHTMFPSSGEGDIHFSITDPVHEPWRGVTVVSRLLAPGGKELSKQVLARDISLNPQGTPLKETVHFAFPSAPSGIYHADVEIRDSREQIFAEKSLELGINPLPKSVLVFCAHEDDEGSHAGMIRAAVENHIPIHVIYFTSGDAGSCDRYYEHSCGPAEALNYGALRMEEARAALGHLGVPRKDIYFLGLPDGGSGQIWWNHISASNPYLAVLLATDHAPYRGLFRPNLPYARRPVIEVTKQFIKRFQPAVIYTAHPDERHVDHRVNDWFVIKALEELLREGQLSYEPTILGDQVYGPGPQKHAPYKYRRNVLYVSGDVEALAQEAEWYYQSQSGNRALGKMRSFDQLPRTEIHWQVLDWKEHEGWNEKR